MKSIKNQTIKSTNPFAAPQKVVDTIRFRRDIGKSIGERKVANILKVARASLSDHDIAQATLLNHPAVKKSRTTEITVELTASNANRLERLSKLAGCSQDELLNECLRMHFKARAKR